MSGKGKPRWAFETFDPRYKELLLRANTETIRIDFTKLHSDPHVADSECYKFQRRLNGYRAAYKYERKNDNPNTDDDTLRALYRVRATRLKSEVGVLLLEPHDDTFDSAFAQVGLSLLDSELDTDPLEDL